MSLPARRQAAGKTPPTKAAASELQTQNLKKTRPMRDQDMNFIILIITVIATDSAGLL